MAASWRRRRSGSPIVIAIIFIGREYETKNYSFEEVNHFMAEKLAVIAKEHGGIMRFVQVSCLGTSPSSPSRMLKAKAAAEEATLRELPVSLKDCMAFEHEADSDLRVRRCRIWQVFAMRKEDRRQPLSKVNGGYFWTAFLISNPVSPFSLSGE